MGVTIKQVAREAEVSVATVSRVLNDSGPVKAETRRRIEAIAARLRYTPNRVAQSLSTRRTKTFGVLLPDLYGEFFSEVIRGLDEVAQTRGYQLLLSSSHSDARGIELAQQAMRGRVDGLVVMAPGREAESLLLDLSEGLPVVLINSHLPGGDFDTINVDNRGGAHAMVSHLIERGHRRVAIIKGAEGNGDAAERLEGYRSALEEGGMERSSELELEGDFTESSGHRAMGEIVRLQPLPTAVFAANDSMAIGALSALHEAGIEVPGRMAVAGFDDIPMSRYLRPPLSSVHVAIHELGVRAMSRLVAQVSERGTIERRLEMLPARVVARASTGGSGRR